MKEENKNKNQVIRSIKKNSNFFRLFKKSPVNRKQEKKHRKKKQRKWSGRFSLFLYFKNESLVFPLIKELENYFFIEDLKKYYFVTEKTPGFFAFFGRILIISVKRYSLASVIFLIPSSFFIFVSKLRKNLSFECLLTSFLFFSFISESLFRTSFLFYSSLTFSFWLFVFGFLLSSLLELLRKLKKIKKK